MKYIADAIQALSQFLDQKNVPEAVRVLIYLAQLDDSAKPNENTISELKERLLKIIADDNSHFIKSKKNRDLTLAAAAFNAVETMADWVHYKKLLEGQFGYAFFKQASQDNKASISRSGQESWAQESQDSEVGGKRYISYNLYKPTPASEDSGINSRLACIVLSQLSSGNFKLEVYLDPSNDETIRVFRRKLLKTGFNPTNPHIKYFPATRDSNINNINHIALRGRLIIEANALEIFSSIQKIMAIMNELKNYRLLGPNDHHLSLFTHYQEEMLGLLRPFFSEEPVPTTRDYNPL